jgi:DHA2 family multidrug resistance protein
MTAEHPFFHRDLAKDRNFLGTTTFGFFVGMLLFSTSALIPSFMQNLLGYSALQSGVASMSRGVGSLIAFLAIPFLVRKFGPKPVLVAGVAISVVALGMMARFDLTMTDHPIIIAGFFQGIGTGLLFAPLNTLAYATLSPVHRVEGTIVATMMRSLGSSLGISLMQAALINRSAVAHANIASRVDASDPVVQSLPAAVNPATPGGMAMLNAEATRQGTMAAYDAVFAWMALGTVFLILLIIFLKPAPPLPPMGQAQAAPSHD